MNSSPIEEIKSIEFGWVLILARDRVVMSKMSMKDDFCDFLFVCQNG